MNEVFRKQLAEFVLQEMELHTNIEVSRGRCLLFVLNSFFPTDHIDTDTVEKAVQYTNVMYMQMFKVFAPSSSLEKLEEEVHETKAAIESLLQEEECSETSNYVVISEFADVIQAMSTVMTKVVDSLCKMKYEEENGAEMSIPEINVATAMIEVAFDELYLIRDELIAHAGISVKEVMDSIIDKSIEMYTALQYHNTMVQMIENDRTQDIETVPFGSIILKEFSISEILEDRLKVMKALRYFIKANPETRKEII